MVQALRQSAGFLFVLSVFATAGWAQDDPPSRVLRLNYTNGNVSMEPAGIDEWAPAVINRPFSTDDYLYTDARSVAELHTDVAAIRLGEFTNAGVLNLTDTALQLKLTQGDLYFRLRDLPPDAVFEIDTPNAAISLLRIGVYRIHVDPNANTTFVVARTGQAEITGGGQALTLNPGDAVSLAGSDALAYSVQTAPAGDAFDNWCAQRDARFESAEATRYVPPTVIGYEDLQDHGVWDETPDYGAVWIPNSVPVDWAPYRTGHWAWIEPWGWTWVDDAAWGFAPFHYGRWVYLRNRWGWAPGPMQIHGPYRAPVLRPVYSPALVAWFGGAHWGVSVAVGGAPTVGWVPLGWGEVYTPCYRVSPRYFNNVNVSNTRVVNNVNITNVYKTVYVNKTVYNQTFANVHAPNAVVAMRQDQFAGGRPVHEGAVSLRQDQFAHFQAAQSTVVAPGVAPSRQSVLSTMGRPAAHPSQEIAARPVVAHATPAPPMAPFAARQSFLQQHAGQAHDYAMMHQAVAVAPARQTAFVREPPTTAQPVIAQPGQQVGDMHTRQNAQAVHAQAPSVMPGNVVAPANQHPASTSNEHANARTPVGNTGQNGAPPPSHHGAPPTAPVPNNTAHDAPRHYEPSTPQRTEQPHPAVEAPREPAHVERQPAAAQPHVEAPHNESQHVESQHKEAPTHTEAHPPKEDHSKDTHTDDKKSK